MSLPPTELLPFRVPLGYVSLLSQRWHWHLWWYATAGAGQCESYQCAGGLGWNQVEWVGFHAFSWHVKDFTIPLLSPVFRLFWSISKSFSQEFPYTSTRAFDVSSYFGGQQVCFLWNHLPAISRWIASRDMVAQQLPPCHGPRCCRGWDGWLGRFFEKDRGESKGVFATLSRKWGLQGLGKEDFFYLMCCKLQVWARRKDDELDLFFQ